MIHLFFKHCFQNILRLTRFLNTTSIGKTNFWTYVLKLFGANLAPDLGLAGSRMPGKTNTPQQMAFNSALNTYGSVGVPITPYDDAGKKNYYPLMKMVARDSSGKVLGSARVVLPVSDEMDCRSCHASGVGIQPPGGWVYDSNPERDYKRNLLRAHDGRSTGSVLFKAALAKAGYLSTGLYATAAAGTPVLCARCHSSTALSTKGVAGVNSLTGAIHSFHATVNDPVTNQRLGDSVNRTACYRCHPGSATRCLRGVMGNSVAADGTMAIQCQNCHGHMADVGRPGRTGWLDEPNCQMCHTGTATSNNGQIRYTSVFVSTGVTRMALNDRFATNPDTPSTGFSLYRFSKGHGGLQCEACHGSTHAEFPSSHANDNLMSQDMQGHAGTVSECASCHKSGVPSTTNGGPHGMHPVGQDWVSRHGDAAEGGASKCTECHGADYRGTVLSRAFADRTLSTEDYGTLTMWKGFQVSCYACHNGPSGESRTTNRPPVVSNATLTASVSTGGSLRFAGSDPNGNTLTYRVVSQPANGTVAVSGNLATYRPFAGYTGADKFTFAAWDGYTNSNLGQVSVTVH